MRMLILSLLCSVLVTTGVTPARGEDCMTSCHKQVLDKKNLHQPVREEDCMACHVKVKAHPMAGGKSFQLAAKGALFCEKCHAPLPLGKTVHAPVRAGDCLACHKPHGADDRKLLDNSTETTALCTGCHDGTFMKQRYVHGPVAVGACTECHSPHAANEKGLLKESGRELCLGCHEDFQDSLDEARIVHAPVRKSPCTSCHNPHGAESGMFLQKKMPDLCIGCHETLAKTLAAVKVPHKPVHEGKGCGNCHSPHFGASRGLFAGDGKGICLDCHGSDQIGTPPLRNIRKEIEGRKYLHGPVRQGQCKACHDPHGSEYARMLRGPYPSELYAPYKEGIYDACLNCHEKNLLRYPDTTIYTNFRNGSRNLHYVHVVNKRKGRTCRICHEPHASDGEKLISTEGSRFGDWKIPLNFRITATGGSCAPGCHRSFAYDREKPLDYTLQEQSR